MNIFNSYKRSKFFLWVNITGLAIGLAASILLILFVVNELSYDKHFTNHNRIVRLITAIESDNNFDFYPVNIRKAYSELPQNVPGIEAAVQLYNLHDVEVISEQKRFQNIKAQLADSEFFKVFQMKFIEGNAETSLASPNAAVITNKYAKIIFGSAGAAMNQAVSVSGMNFVVSGVVEELPKNTHFNFDILGNIKVNSWIESAGGLEFLTYYIIKKEASLQAVRDDIEREYRILLKPFVEAVGNQDIYGLTEKLGDIHLKSKIYGAEDNMRFIKILTGLALFILILAITNFVNLYITQGEMRMKEIGIRKSNGAQISNIIKLFFSEVAIIVGIAFLIGFFLATICAPYFSTLVNKNIDLIQLLNPVFILSIIFLFILTVTLSAFYPAVYLSRFSPLDIFGKRIKFSKRRLTAVTVVFQSVISIILLSVTLVYYKQSSYLQNLPLGLNPENVMSVYGNEAINKSYQAIKQELLNFPEVKIVSGSEHLFGGGTSGQIISLWGAPKEHNKQINEYRLLTGMPELMELELVEGRFWQESDPDSIRMLILNETAAKLLGGESPLDKTYSYWGQAKVIGVVKDFYFFSPTMTIPAIALNRVFNPRIINIRFNEGVNSIQAKQITQKVFQKFDPDFVLNPIWSVDIYNDKFKDIKTLSLTVLIGSAISIFIAMLGLLAIHLYSAVRRTKEIGIRRIHGAEKTSVFMLLSIDILKWIGIAALFAVPAAVYIISEILNNYANRVKPDWTIFVLPVLIQCVIAILTTSGVSLSVLSQNPVKSLKSE